MNLRRRVVVESNLGSRGSLSQLGPTHHSQPISQTRPLQDDADESTAQPVLEPTQKVATPQNASAPFQPSATTQATPPSGTPTGAPQPAPQECITIRLPGRLIERQDAHPARTPGEFPSAIEPVDDQAELGSDDGANAPMRPTHDVSYLPTSPQGDPLWPHA